MKEKNLTEGNIFGNLIKFSIPYLLSCFLQTFYGLADLFIAGQFNGASTITAVSVGSQLMHAVTVMIVGLAMGCTITVGHMVGSGNKSQIKKVIGNSAIIFAITAFLITALMILFSNQIMTVLSTPQEALAETKKYMIICGLGVIFITAFNVFSSIFRGLGDTKTPMYFIALSGVINIGMDYILIGNFRMGATGAAIATVFAQAVSVIAIAIYAGRKLEEFKLSRDDFKISGEIAKSIIFIGIPVAAQDGFIQVAFLVITAVANRRGVDTAAAVGIVEKLISFMFLFPSAMLSAVSAICSQNVGAGKHKRCSQTLLYGILVGLTTGAIFTVICNICPELILGWFAKDEEMVIVLGSQYLRAYVFDCMFAAIHFCFSGYFCAYGKSYLSFLHNVLSIVLVRIPGAIYAAIAFPDTLFPMGMAAPLGSLFSAIICFIAFCILIKRIKKC